MLRSFVNSRKAAAWIAAFSLVVATLVIPTKRIGAADHGDAPASSNDRSCDIADVYAFLDPNDNTKMILGMTVQGFIVPSEAANFGIFDPNVGYLFDLETTGDARADHQIEVTFTEKINSAATPQTMYVGSSFFPTFSAQTTVANLNPTGPDPVITTNPQTGISVFAGLVDDPFFFDIPGFNRFVASVVAGSPNPATLNRGRDSFAGYNTLAIAISVPLSYLRDKVAINGNTIGVAGRTGRRRTCALAASRRTRGAARPAPGAARRSGRRAARWRRGPGADSWRWRKTRETFRRRAFGCAGARCRASRGGSSRPSRAGAGRRRGGTSHRAACRCAPRPRATSCRRPPDPVVTTGRGSRPLSGR